MVRKKWETLEKMQISPIREVIVSSKYFVWNVKLRNVKLGNDCGVEENSLCLSAEENTRMQVGVWLPVWTAPHWTREVWAMKRPCVCRVGHSTEEEGSEWHCMETGKKSSNTCGWGNLQWVSSVQIQPLAPKSTPSCSLKHLQSLWWLSWFISQ